MNKTQEILNKKVAIDFPDGNGNILKVYKEDAVLSMLDEMVSSYTTAKSTVLQMIPFELKGDLDRFQDAYLPTLVEAGVKYETAVTIISSVWLFVNNVYSGSDGMPTDIAFEKRLSSLINMHSKENDSNTPDFILAKFISDCLENFNKATVARDNWQGRGTKQDIEPIAIPGFEEALSKLPIG